MKITPSINNSYQKQTNLKNRAVANKLPQNSLSFTGDKKLSLVTRAVNNICKVDLQEQIAKGVAWLSQTKASEKLVEWTQKLPNATARWADLESVAITIFYMWNTWKSDKIEEDRKVPSMIQNAAVTIASSGAALVIDEACQPFINKLTEAYENLPKEKIKKLAEIRAKGLSAEELKELAEKGKDAAMGTKDFYDASCKFKTNTVFTAVVRFIVPVLMVPVVGKIVEKMKANKAQEEEAANNNNQETAQNTQGNNNQTIEFATAKQGIAQSQLNTTQGYVPILNFDEHNKENNFKSLYV